MPLLLAVWGLLAGPAGAASAGPRFTSEADPQSYAHAGWLGSGFYSVGGRQVYILRLEMGFLLRESREERLGVRLTLKPALGFYDFKPTDTVDFGLPESVGTASLLPGVELIIPVLSRWQLKPLAEVGPAVEMETGTTTWVYGVGVESRAGFLSEASELILWNTLLWAGNWESDVADGDDFGLVETAVEWRFLTGWTMRGVPLTLGPLLRAESYVDALRIDPPEGEDVEIRRRYEAGFTMGPAERSRIWKITVPRWGFSWRFGEGENGYRVVLTTRF